MDEAELLRLMINGVRVGQYDEETGASLGDLAESLSALWQVDVDGIPPAVGFDPGAGWDDRTGLGPDAAAVAGDAWTGF